MILHTKGTKIVDGTKEVSLRGINLGGWLMMEAYILHAPNFAEQLFKKKFAARLGPEALADFERTFRANFIREEDIADIRRLGMNCIRVPFNHRLIEKRPFVYEESGLKYLDDVIAWAGKNRIWVILDLHGAPGGQNHDWHSDSLGKAELWTKASNRKRTYALWEMLAGRYKKEPWVAGYDLLNEPVMNDMKLLNEFYRETIRAVRRADKDHIIFVEGNKWSTIIDGLDEYDDDNYALHIHSYEPLQFTFNFTPHLRYPSKGKVPCGPALMRKHLMQYVRAARQRDLPVLLGEFGVNYRGGLYGEHQWLADKLAMMNEFGFHWTYWTYKAVKNSTFPDGIYSCYDNHPWIRREGNISGWDTYVQQWPLNKKRMAESWRTENFLPNAEIIAVLKEYTRRPGS